MDDGDSGNSVFPTLAKVLSAPSNSQINSEEHAAAAAAVIAAVGASVAADAAAEQAAQAETNAVASIVPSTAFDVSSIENLSPASQDELVKNQAAKTLQLIALSFSNAGPHPAEHIGLSTEDQEPEKDESHPPMDPALATLEQVLREHAAVTASAAPDTDSTSLATANTKLEDDTHAFAQAVLKAMQADAIKSSQTGLDSASTLASLSHDNHHVVDNQGELSKLNYQTASMSDGGPDTTTISSINPATSAAPNSSQGFTFELDKATGKTQIKWTTDTKADPKDSVTTSLEDSATAIQLALQTLYASTGIAGLSELSVASGGLMAPPVGHFPVQGSEFGTAQEPPALESTPTEATAAQHSRPHKKRKTGGSSKQNTAASIPEGSPSFPCTYPGCEKVFARLYNLKSHSRTHTDERPFVCSNCQLAFSRNHDLRRHVKIHGGDKVFKCDGCGKSFSRLDALGRHRNNSKNRPGCQAVPEAST
ncbi:hypothetical protein EDD11_000418 [Mortierella claussenii]|nr:hypothetical protein EDD11_000418 [Mortierella claussenii]